MTNHAYQPFPEIDHQHEAMAHYVLVQIRRARDRVGSIILAAESQAVEQYNADIGKVVSVGPLAFRDRETGEPWPGTTPVQPGEFVRFPQYGGKSFWLEHNGQKEGVKFALFRDSEILAKVVDPTLSLVHGK